MDLGLGEFVFDIKLASELGRVGVWAGIRGEESRSG